jgi:hypothetical protein
VTDHLRCNTVDAAYDGFAGVGVGHVIKAREATVAATLTSITVMAAGKGFTAERAAAVVTVTREGVAAAAAAVAGSEHDIHVLTQSTGTGAPRSL